MTHPNESLSPLNGDAGVAQVGAVSDGRLRELAAYPANFTPANQVKWAKDMRSLLNELLSRRAANTTGTVFDMVAHLQRQRDWSGKTFGPGPRTAGVVDHIRKELREIEADPSDITEWIDVVILALDGAWRAGYQPQEIIDAMVAKQTKNEARNWPDWRTMSPDKAIEHDRSVQGEEPVGWETDAEWELETRVFNAANNREVPEWARKVISDVWKQYCLAARPSPAVSAEVTDEMAMACDEWPSWLSEAVERTNEFADRADASTEQAVAFGILSILGGGK